MSKVTVHYYGDWVDSKQTEYKDEYDHEDIIVSFAPSGELIVAKVWKSSLTKEVEQTPVAIYARGSWDRAYVQED